RERAQFKAPGDNRDAEFIVLPDGRLAATWVAIPRTTDGNGRNAHVPLLTTTENGLTWSDPQTILTPGHHLFSIREHKGRYCGLDCVRPGPDERMLHLLVSEDGVHWERLSQVGPDELMANEA